MSWIEVLVEGSADVPVLREVLTRRFLLAEGQHFRIHAHQGKGNLPSDVIRVHNVNSRCLLNQLPAKLKAFGRSFTRQQWVLVVIDADKTCPGKLLGDLNDMLRNISSPPRTLFFIAVEETESWFIADTSAVKKAYPRSKLAAIKKISPDAVCGAWEKLAEAIQATEKDKVAWAEKISPHLNLDNPRSPSFLALLRGIDKELKAQVS